MNKLKELCMKKWFKILLLAIIIILALIVVFMITGRNSESSTEYSNSENNDFPKNELILDLKEIEKYDMSNGYNNSKDEY